MHIAIASTDMIHDDDDISLLYYNIYMYSIISILMFVTIHQSVNNK